jgi:hypothetical protein
MKNQSSTGNIVPRVLSKTLDLGEKFITLFKVAKKELWGSDAEAFEKLRDVIDELMKFYLAMQKELSDFVSMDFSSPHNNRDNLKSLYGIMSGSLKVRISDAKGHCSRIEKIYEKHLDKWLRKKLTSDDYNEINMLFKELAVYDYDMLEAAKNLELDLQAKSVKLIDLVNKNKAKDAVNYQVDVRMQLLPELIKLSTVMDQLISLRNDFMDITSVD